MRYKDPGIGDMKKEIYLEKNGIYYLRVKTITELNFYNYSESSFRRNILYNI